jgi:hypothetical protein
MERRFNVKGAVFAALQWLGALISFIVCLILVGRLLPLPGAITDATPPSGFVSLPIALLLSGVVNATVLVWAARRSSFSGAAMWLQLLVLCFGATTFLTQIESGYFVSAFPLLQGNFVVYLLILRGFVTALAFTLIVTLLVGGFARRPRPEPGFAVHADHAVRMGAWLAAAYFVLYEVFGYYVAWQSQEVRLFYGGPAQLNPALNQYALTLMARPEFPVFQYFRGVLWLLCLIPLFKGFSGKHLELAILSFLALGYLPTIQLTFPNPLMPPGVALAHFWETSISTGIFGALCAWFVPRAAVAAS